MLDTSLVTALDMGTMVHQQPALSVGASIGFVDPDDYFKVTLDSPGIINVDLFDVLGPADLQLIRDWDGNRNVDDGDVLASSRNSGIATDSITRLSDRGIYYVRVFESFKQTDPITLFGLRVNVQYTAGPYTTPDLIEPGEKMGTARDLKALPGGSRTIHDFVGDTDPDDFYRFTLAAPAEVTLLLNGLTGDADLRLIRDADGNRSVDTGDTLASSFKGGLANETFTRLSDAGTYFVQVDGPAWFNTAANYDLTITVTFTAGPYTTPDLIEPGEKMGTARDLKALPGGSRTIHDFVGDTDPDDFYRFTLAAPAEVTLLLNGLTGDADLRLIRDADGNRSVDTGDTLASSFKGGLANETFTRSLVAGTYFVQVEGPASFNTAANYDLTMTTDYMIDTRGSALNLGPVRGRQSVSDFVSSTHRNDFYRFSVPARGTFRATLSGLPADADLLLLRPNGTVLTSSRRAGTSNEFLAASLLPGNYYLRVFGKGTDTNYNLTLTTDFAGSALATAWVVGELPRPRPPFTRRLTFSDFIGSTDKIDIYRVHVARTGTFRAEFSGLEATADIVLLRPNGRKVASSTRTGSTTASLMARLGPGDYYLRIGPIINTRIGPIIDTNYALTLSI